MSEFSQELIMPEDGKVIYRLWRPYGPTHGEKRVRYININEKIHDLCALLGIKVAKGEDKAFVLSPDILLFRAVGAAVRDADGSLPTDYRRGMAIVGPVASDISRKVLEGRNIYHLIDDVFNQHFSPVDADDMREADLMYLAYSCALSAFWRTVEQSPAGRQILARDTM